MRIALVILHADPSRGGAERYTIDLAAALAKRGHDVSLLATSFADVPKGVRRVDLAAGGFTRTRRYYRMLNALDRHLDSTTYDVVHAMLPVRRCDVYHPHAGIAAEMSEWSDALLRPRRHAMALVERELLTRVGGPVILCLSEYVKGIIREHYFPPDERLVTLFNAVDIERFHSTTRTPNDRVNALFIGQDFARKGLPRLLAAMTRLSECNIKLTVVGKDSGSPALPPRPDRPVAFVGGAKDPLPFYRDADFFVLPTRHDPCSLVVLEALAMGLPVISTRFNGACEIMTDGVHGFVLRDPLDVDALTAAMRKMLDPQLRAKMSAACLELRPQLSYERHLDRLIQIYQGLAIQSSPRKTFSPSPGTPGEGGGEGSSPQRRAAGVPEEPSP